MKAVAEGVKIHSPDPSDPIDAQQVFVDSALMKHSTRLLEAEDPNVELPHVVFEEQSHLLNRIMEKCLPKDVSEGTKIALLGTWRQERKRPIIFSSHNVRKNVPTFC